MEVGTAKITEQKPGNFSCVISWIEALCDKLKSKVVDVARNIKKVGQDDPRRVIHSLKVGLALTLVSIFYYYQPLFDSFGVSAMWAVMTVVVVFEFSVGATLAKGINRGVATLMAGTLAVGAHHIANLSGHIGEPIVLGFFVFLQATIFTFVRFFPKIKARYDYGMLIFILTFSLISVSGFRDDEVLELAHKRLSTILIGGCVCLVIAVVIFPVWAGEDLHNLISLNIEKLGDFLEGFGDEYFKATENDDSNKDKRSMVCYKSVLNSKANEESLANFARWEPGHGRFKFRHPWQQYLTVGALTQTCAYRIDALNGYLNPELLASQEVKSKIQEECTELSKESGKALKQLSTALKTMTRPSSANLHIKNAKLAVESLNSLLKSAIWEDEDLLKVIRVASLLIEVKNCTEKIAESIYELACRADFKSVEATVSPEKRKPSRVDQCPEVVIEINESIPDGLEDENSSATKNTNKHMEAV